MGNQEKENSNPQKPGDEIIDGEFTVLDSSATEKPDYVINIPYSGTPEEENFALKDKVEAKVKEYLEMEDRLEFYNKGLTESGLEFFATQSDEQVQEMRRLASSKLAREAGSDDFDLKSTRKMLEMMKTPKGEIDAIVKKTHFENLIKKAMEAVKKEATESEAKKSTQEIGEQKKLSDLHQALDSKYMKE